MKLNEWIVKEAGPRAGDQVAVRKKLAEACDTNEAYLRQVETGHRSPSLKLACKIEKHTGFKVDLYEFWEQVMGEAYEPA